jgi:hypothetical protein
MQIDMLERNKKSRKRSNPLTPISAKDLLYKINICSITNVRSSIVFDRV